MGTTCFLTNNKIMDFLSIADDQSLKMLAGYNVGKGGMARSYFAKYK